MKLPANFSNLAPGAIIPASTPFNSEPVMNANPSAVIVNNRFISESNGAIERASKGGNVAAFPPGRLGVLRNPPGRLRKGYGGRGDSPAFYCERFHRQTVKIERHNRNKIILAGKKRSKYKIRQLTLLTKTYPVISCW